MTTPAHSDLAHTLTNYYFGQTVGSVVKKLFEYDQASLKLLKFSLPRMRLSDLKRSLLILVKYQLVDYIKTVKNFKQQYEYSVVPQRIFSFFRIQRFIQVVGQGEGSTASLLIKLVMLRGLISKDELIVMLADQIRQTQAINADTNNLNSQLSDLVQRLILKRYIVQTGNNICINFDRFNRKIRYDVIIDTIFNHYDKDTRIKHLCRTILDLTDDNTADEAVLTAPATLLDLCAALVPHVFVDKKQLESYLAALSSETNFRLILSCGIHPNKGPMYAVGVGHVIDYLVKEHLSSVITTRFGPKCCRVFKVLLTRGPMLLKQVEEVIMLPARDVREYSYMLMKDAFVRNRQVPKTPDNAPGKSVFIMSIELDNVVYNITDLCCRSMNNLVVRYQHELTSNKILLDKSRECIKSNVPREEWNEYFTTHELSQLETINKSLNKLLMAKAQVDETLFLLHTWIQMRPNLEMDEVS